MANILAILNVKIVIFVITLNLFFALRPIVEKIKNFIIKADNFEQFLSTPKPTI